MELSDQKFMDNPSNSATMNEAKLPSTNNTASSNPPRSMEDEGKEWRGSTLPKTLSKVIDFLVHSDTTHEETLKALYSTPYFPPEIRDKYRDALQRLEAATQESERATATTSGGTNEESRVSAEASSFEQPQDPNNMSFAQINPLLDIDSQQYLDEMANVSPEEKRLKLAKLFFANQAEVDRKMAVLQTRRENLQARRENLQIVLEIRKLVVPALIDMRENVQSIKTAMDYLACLPQANASTSGTDFGTGTNEMIEREAREGMKNTTAAGESPEHIQKLLLPQNIIEIRPEELLQEIQTGSKRRIAYDKLKKVAGALEAWVSKANVIDSEDSSMKDKVKRGIEWMSHHIKDTNVDTEGPKLDEDLWLPKILSRDLNAFPPVVLELLSQVGFCLEGFEPPLHGGPSKTQVQQNQSVSPTTHYRNKIADRGVLKPLVSDCARKLVVDMNPVDKKSLDQVLSRLVQYLWKCLDFHGHGAPSFATGMTATLTHVKVVRLYLALDSFCPETKTMAKLKLHISPRLPLMTKQSFNEWASKVNPDEKETKDIRKLRDSLYGAGNQGVDEEGIPLGLRIVWEHMLKRHSENFGPDYQTIFHNSCSTDIDELLGGGTFSLVFGLKNANRVLKLPRSQLWKHIEKERTILEKLHRTRDPQDPARTIVGDVALPILERNRQISLTLGGVQTVTTCLELSPKGMPILDNLTSCFGIEDSIQWNQKISHSLKSVAEALDYMHQKGICHNDVNPSNMVLTRAGGGVRIILVDLSSACSLEDTLVGFLGTRVFTHKDIFEKYPDKSWSPETRYDFFGLALSFCTLLNGGRLPWKVDGLLALMRYSLDEQMSERQTIAEDLIRKSGCDEKDMEQWLKWLAADNDTTNSVRPGKRKQEDDPPP